MTVEQSVMEHYTHGALMESIDVALAAAGKDLAHLRPEDLSAVDEFHIGGRAATIAFADELGVVPGLHLLDIGSGLGGPSRYFAEMRGCRVTGIDLTAEYVDAASELARRVGLDDRVLYQQGSATALPFEAASFDGATMMHVGMNIADKAGVFAEIRRVLKPGARFGIYDVMREGDGEFAYPVPWATVAATSFVDSADSYVRLLEAAGFVVEKRRSRGDFAITSMEAVRAQALAAGGPPVLGLHVVVGKTASQKTSNLLANLKRGLLAPTEIISRAA